MQLRILGPVVATALVLTAVPATTATAEPGPARKVKVSVTLPTTVVEGERFTLEAKLSRTDGAKTIQLQRATTGSGWELVAKSKVRKKKTYTFTDIAGADDLMRYRIKVKREKGGALTSAPAETAVWHWRPMTDFDSYFQTPGVSYGNNVHMTISGVTYRGGWETSGKTGSWETRITPGRHCRSFRGLVGVTDDSADGSSAVISLVADETTTVYTSPTLAPGAALPVQLDLALPFRLSVRAQRLSSPAVEVYPALANPELLCTGVG